MTEKQSNTLELVGVTFEFKASTVITAAGFEECTVTLSIGGTYEQQTFPLPPDVDHRAYALGWWHCRMRQILDFL